MLRNSVVACVATVVLALALALLVAYPVTRLPVAPGFRRGLLSWLLSLRFLPSMVVVVPIFATVRLIGLYDRLLALVLIYTAFSLPFAVWMLKGFLLEVPAEVDVQADQPDGREDRDDDDHRRQKPEAEQPRQQPAAEPRRHRQPGDRIRDKQRQRQREDHGRAQATTLFRNNTQCPLPTSAAVYAATVGCTGKRRRLRVLARGRDHPEKGEQVSDTRGDPERLRARFRGAPGGGGGDAASRDLLREHAAPEREQDRDDDHRVDRFASADA